MIKLANIKVRKATIEDAKNVLMMAYEFYNEFIGGPKEDFDTKTIAEYFRNVINMKDGEIFVAQNGTSDLLGMVFVMLSPAYYNPNKRVVEEHHLYIKPDYRHSSVTKVLLQAIKEWAKNKRVPWIRAGITPDYKLKFKVYKGENNGNG